MTDSFVFEGGDGLGFGDSSDESVGGEFSGLFGQDVDRVARGLSKLPYQFQESTNLKFLLATLLSEVQELENALQSVHRGTILEYASGVTLDVIGERCGIRRTEGQSDDNYRKKIELKILVNTTHGTYAETKAILKKAISGNITISPEYPAGFLFAPDTPIPQDDTMSIVSDGIPLTVKMSTLAKYSANNSFCFAGGSGAGFGSVGYTGVGGEIRGRKEFT